jgi:hypothetical protein
MQTFDKIVLDSTGAFLISELEKLDLTLHEPLIAVTWSRDVDLREDVSIADDASSFTNSTFAATGGFTSTGKNFIGRDSNAIPGIGLDIGKTSAPLFLWGMEVSYTIPELIAAQQLGRSVDTQKYEGMQKKYQMDIDEMVYIGDTSLVRYGLVNSTQVTTGFVSTKASGFTQWIPSALNGFVGATADEILNDINSLIQTAWTNAVHVVCPSKLLLPPAQFAYIISQKVSTAGNISIKNFLEDNCISLSVNGKKLDIQPLKWLTGRGVAAGSPSAATDRMVAYTQDRNRVRYPLVPLQRTPLEFRSLYHITTYFGKLGCVEVVYPETLLYRDGI